MNNNDVDFHKRAYFAPPSSTSSPTLHMPTYPLVLICTCLPLQIFVLSCGHVVVATSGGLEQRRIPGYRSEQLAAVFASLISGISRVPSGFLDCQCQALARLEIDTCTGRLKVRWSAQYPWNMHGVLCDQREDSNDGSSTTRLPQGKISAGVSGVGIHYCPDSPACTIILARFKAGPRDAISPDAVFIWMLYLRMGPELLSYYLGWARCISLGLSTSNYRVGCCSFSELIPLFCQSALQIIKLCSHSSSRCRCRHLLY